MKNAKPAVLLAKRCAIAIGFALFLASCNSEPAAETSTETITGESETAETVVPEPATDSTAPVAPATTQQPAQQPADQPTAEDKAVAQATAQPERGRLTQLQNGDLLCYATVVDSQGQEYTVGATFEICDREAELMNQDVAFVYSIENVADCESAEPCGRTRQERIVTDVIAIGESWQVLSNGTWTVTVGQLESWDGVNNTGALTYYGCDDQGNCLALDNGSNACHRGMCIMAWQNGDYVYTLESEIVEAGDGDTTLRVFQDGIEILAAENMQVVEASDI
ncbi:MAG: hypothetical protein AAFX78_16525 [Cyanobacteria bacterium J06638_20]